MNFLSHFYFDRFTENPHVVMGIVLPDLIKNAAKEANLYPQKNAFLFKGNTDEESLLLGWKRHLAVDLHFHSSPFFFEKTAALKPLIKPITTGTAIRPSFLAHIGLELLLDHLLVLHHLVDIERFYTQLAAVNRSAITDFLHHCGWKNDEVFFKFLDQFLNSRYLFSYLDLNKISYALNQICKRLWPEALNEKQKHALTTQLLIFKAELEKDFISIFEDIDKKLKHNI